MQRLTHRLVGALLAVATAAGLGVAIAAENFLGLVPCALCLWERWPYRLAFLLAACVTLGPRAPALSLLAAAELVMMGAVGLGVVHVGVEQGLWSSPLPECAAPRLGSGSIAERLAAMPAHPAKPCDDPTYLIPSLPLSMAAMNVLYALLICLTLAIYIRHSFKEST
jgi:disulfide bond formation protein DsbB